MTEETEKATTAAYQRFARRVSQEPNSADKVEQGVNDPMMPVVWTRLYKNEAGNENKILGTTLGAATDLQDEGLRRLLVNSVFWGVGIEVPAKADVTYVDDFKPLMYGFGSGGIGIKPSDRAVGVVLPLGRWARPVEKKAGPCPQPPRLRPSSAGARTKK